MGRRKLLRGQSRPPSDPPRGVASHAPRGDGGVTAARGEEYTDLGSCDSASRRSPWPSSRNAHDRRVTLKSLGSSVDAVVGLDGSSIAKSQRPLSRVAGRQVPTLRYVSNIEPAAPTLRPRWRRLAFRRRHRRPRSRRAALAVVEVARRRRQLARQRRRRRRARPRRRRRARPQGRERGSEPEPAGGRRPGGARAGGGARSRSPS